MNCEEAENLLSARLDDEVRADDPARVELEAHLAECAACRETAESMQIHDAELVRAFAPGRRCAQAVAERAVAALGDDATSLSRAHVVYVRAPRSRLWLTGLAASAIAAGIVLAIVTLGPRLRGGSSRPVIAAAQPIAQVALSTGDVYACSSRAPTAWQVVSAGAALAEGDCVRTGPSARVELRLADGSQVRLNGATEARLNAGRCVELKQGQLWSAVPLLSPPLSVAAPPSPPAAGGTVTAITPPGSSVDFACAPAGPVLTAVRGPARVTDKRGIDAEVPPGMAMTLVNGVAPNQSVPSDALLTTRWLNDLLVLKGRDDPELAGRVRELLSRVKLESSTTRPDVASATPGPVEQLIRAQGERWCDPLACHVQSPASQSDRPTRLTAARLLSDLAPPSAIPDLITLLADRDGDIRFHAATALHRLTGQNLGRTPEQCATDPAESAQQTHKTWQAWWEQNKGRYESRGRGA